jgi:hypothetical protein
LIVEGLENGFGRAGFLFVGFFFAAVIAAPSRAP